MDFEDKYNEAPEWQKERYKRFLEITDGIELTEHEKSYLLWLAGYDYDTESAFTTIFEKLIRCRSER